MHPQSALEQCGFGVMAPGGTVLLLFFHLFHGNLYFQTYFRYSVLKIHHA